MATNLVVCPVCGTSYPADLLRIPLVAGTRFTIRCVTCKVTMDGTVARSWFRWTFPATARKADVGLDQVVTINANR